MAAGQKSRRPFRRLATMVCAGLAAAVIPPAVEPARSLSPLPGPTAPAGYWLVASDGGIFSFGDAEFLGSTGDIKLNRPIVGMTATPTGKGYWLVASDGGIFSYGDATFFGSTGAVKLNKPIVGMTATPTGRGYWLVASDGGIFSYGDATFHGAAAESTADAGIVGMKATPTGRGYWQAGSTGKVFAFGDATPHGSTGTLNVPAVSMAATPTGGGYWLTSRDGGIFAFGDARFLGSTGDIRLNQPIVGMAPVPPPGAAPSASTTVPTNAPAGGSGPAPTTTTTAPGQVIPHHAAAHPADPDGNPPEPFDEPMISPNGGPSFTEVSSDPDVPHSAPPPWNVTPRSCGFPEFARRTILPDDTDYIGEGSGLTASRQYPGVNWVIRDSGHTAAVNLVRFDADGYVTTREMLVEGAVNGDWEEVNYTLGPDGRGRLWVVDNGGTARTPTGALVDVPRTIYEIVEPDPDMPSNGVDAKGRPTWTVPFVNSYPWALPTSTAVEAAFMSRGYLVVVTKTEPHARMYRFDTLTPGTLNQPTYIGQLGNSKSVSVVRQSPDGQLLITASHQQVHLYRSIDGSGSIRSFAGRLPDCSFRAFPDEHVEGGEFTGDRQLHFVTEDKRVIRLNVAP